MMGLIGLVGYRSSESGKEDEGDEDDEGGFGGRLVMSVQMGLGAAAVALLAHTAQRLQGSLAKREERAVSVATAALAVCAPTLRWTLPTLLLGAAGAGLLRRWSILRARGLLRRDGGAASADAAEATVPCQPALEHARDAQDGAESAQGGAQGGDERAGEYEERVAAVRAGRDPERVPTVPIPVPPAWALACAVLWVGVPVALLLLRASDIYRQKNCISSLRVSITITAALQKRELQCSRQCGPLATCRPYLTCLVAHTTMRAAMRLWKRAD
jgi:hypothetical protein